MAAKFPVLAGVGGEYFWYGNVCLSYDLMPHVGAADEDPALSRRRQRYRRRSRYRSSP